MISDAWLDRSSSPAPLVRGLAKNPAAPIDVLLRLVETRPEQACEGYGAAANCRRRCGRRCSTIPRPGSAAHWPPTRRSTCRRGPSCWLTRRDIDVTTVPGDGHFGSADVRCRWIPYPDDAAPELTDALRWACSVNPLLRRRAARNAELPAEIVTILADDPDLGVRVLLAQHHSAAPPALLLRCFLEYHCCGRDRLSELPQFPTEGLARFADDPDPAVRRLVALDPRITALLEDPELAEAAAANPALPVDRMQQILEEGTAG